MELDLVLGLGSAMAMLGFGVIAPIVNRLRGRPTIGDCPSVDGLGCPTCGHVPTVRPVNAPWRRGQAICWHGDDVSGWGTPLYCGCPHVFHAS